MIQFVVKLARGHIRKIPSTYPALIEYESRFKIIIDNKIFFDDPNFPLFEFLKYAVEWEKNPNGSFEYRSIETEDNPLIFFSYENSKFRVFSPWQKFECQLLFTKKDIIDAINTLLTEVISC